MHPRSRFLQSSRGHRLLCGLASLIATLSVGGCGLYGDFDRVRPSLATDEANARIEREELIRSGKKPSNFPLTDEERQLHYLARAIIPPPNDRNRWDTVFRDYVLDDIEFLGTAKEKREPVKFDRAAYWKDLHEDERRSEASAYSKLITDAREDVIRIEAFFAISARVADMDHKRDAVLALAASSNAAERSNARRRNQENVAIVMLTCRALGERMISYNYALERLAIQAPSSRAADGERALTLLHTRIGQYCRSGQLVTAKG
jgi:hypothetical protein